MGLGPAWLVAGSWCSNVLVLAAGVWGLSPKSKFCARASQHEKAGCDVTVIERVDSSLPGCLADYIDSSLLWVAWQGKR